MNGQTPRSMKYYAHKGTSPDMLERMRLFYLHYLQISDGFSAPRVRKSVAHDPAPLTLDIVLWLSWKHLVELVRLTGLFRDVRKARKIVCFLLK